MDSSGSNGQNPGDPPYSNQNGPYPPSYPVNPAYSNQYASYPQPQYQAPYQGAMQQVPQYQGAMQQASYGPVQQGYGRFPLQNRGRDDKYRKENPCCCCCGTVTAAKTLAVLNVIYLVWETWGLAKPESMLEEEAKGETIYPHFSCQLDQRKEGTWLYILVIILFSLGISAFLCATIGFITVVFGKTRSKTELLWSKIYMWVSFCYPGWLCHILLLVDILMIDHSWCYYLNSLWAIYITYSTFILIWIVFNGLVGRAYRNMAQRKNQALEGDQSQDANEAAPDTSSPTEAEAAPEGEAEKAEASGTEVP